MRGSLLAMRLIGKILNELRLPHAANSSACRGRRRYPSGETQLQDIGPDARTDTMHYSHAAGSGDALALANLAVVAHGSLAEDAYDPEANPDLERLDFHTMIVMLTAERFGPDILSALRAALGETGATCRNYSSTGWTWRGSTSRPSPRKYSPRTPTGS